MLAVSQVSPLRKKMIEDMQLHGLSENTQELYARAVSQLSKYVHRSPDNVSEEDIREYEEVRLFSDKTIPLLGGSQTSR